jgi:hypothetical protein
MFSSHGLFSAKKKRANRNSGMRASLKIAASSSGFGGVFHQALDGIGGLRTHRKPVSQAVLRQAQHFGLARGHGVVEAEALNEAAITTIALGSNHDVVERAGFRATAGESNDDHKDSSFEFTGFSAPETHD